MNTKELRKDIITRMRANEADLAAGARRRWLSTGGVCKLVGEHRTQRVVAALRALAEIDVLNIRKARYYGERGNYWSVRRAEDVAAEIAELEKTAREDSAKHRILDRFGELAARQIEFHYDSNGPCLDWCTFEMLVNTYLGTDC